MKKEAIEVATHLLFNRIVQALEQFNETVPGNQRGPSGAVDNREQGRG